MKKILKGATLLLCFTTLFACSNQNESDKSQKEFKNISKEVKEITPPIWKEETKVVQDPKIRLSFETITVADESKRFENGTTLEEVKELYGAPSNHVQQSFGEIILDEYLWKVSEAKIVVQFYKNNTVAKSISNFEFDREKFVSEELIREKIKKGTNQRSVLDTLGLPDVASEGVASEGKNSQLIWSSNLKDEVLGRYVQIDFVNGKVTKVAASNQNIQFGKEE